MPLPETRCPARRLALIGLILAGLASACSDGVTEIRVRLDEWNGTPSESQVVASKVKFVVTNKGTDPHELAIVRTDLPHDRLPLVPREGGVDETVVQVVGAVKDLRPGQSGQPTVELEPGQYALICNLVAIEIAEGEVEPHYQMGMHTAFTVTQ